MRPTPVPLALLTSVTALAFVLAGCGGFAPATTKQATTSAPPAAAPASSNAPAAAAPSAPAPSLSKFENRPPVIAARAFEAALGRATNTGDRSLRVVRRYATDRGLYAAKWSAKADFNHGWHVPGPEPFTPVAVRTHGDASEIDLCMLAFGWSISPKSGKVTTRRKVLGYTYQMKRDANRWKFDWYKMGTFNCKGVPITEVRW